MYCIVNPAKLDIAGTTIKIHKVDLRKSEVCEPLVLHAKAEYTVSDLKNALEKVTSTLLCLLFPFKVVSASAKTNVLSKG